MGKRALIHSSKSPTEKQVERYLRDKVAAVGGKAYKFTSPAQRSVPDRLCIFPFGIIAFVEVKRPGGKLTEGQKRELDYLRSMYQFATVVFTKGDVDHLMAQAEVLIKEKAAIIEGKPKEESRIITL